MSYIIRNISISPVIIDDLGVTLSIGEDYDLVQDAQVDVALSTDLYDNINNNNIVILDPLDGVTPLSKQDSLVVFSTTNSPPYRIVGGTLSQLDDVDGTPLDAQVLTYNGSLQKWEPNTSTGGGSSGCLPFWYYDGTQHNITTISNKLPFYLFDNTPSFIDLIPCN